MWLIFEIKHKTLGASWMVFLFLITTRFLNIKSIKFKSISHGFLAYEERKRESIGSFFQDVFFWQIHTHFLGCRGRFHAEPALVVLFCLRSSKRRRRVLLCSVSKNAFLQKEQAIFRMFKKRASGRLQCKKRSLKFTYSYYWVCGNTMNNLNWS